MICRSFTFDGFDEGEGTTQYYGIIKWRLKHKELLLIENPKEKNEKKIRLLWEKEPKGDPRNQLGCIQAVDKFVESYETGGPHGREQWLECLHVHNELWEAARIAWGWPRIIAS